MGGSYFATGWPFANPVQQFGPGISPYGPYAGPASNPYSFGVPAVQQFGMPLQQITQLLQLIPHQLQKLQQLEYLQQHQLQQLQQLLTLVPQQLQQIQQAVQYLPQHIQQTQQYQQPWQQGAFGSQVTPNIGVPFPTTTPLWSQGLTQSTQLN